MPDRRRTRAQERTDDIDISPTALVAQIEALTTERDEATRVAEEYLVALQRERAEFQNFKRRTTEERLRELGLAGEDLIRKVLNVADDPWFEGISAIDRKLRGLLESEGVSSIDASPGRPFDPREHEAIANVAGSGHPEGSIVDVVRRGYKLRDRVIRPALVAVAADPAPTT